MPNKNIVNKNIVIENARIGFRNFTGKEGRFNPAGRRNFCVFLETVVAKDLETDGWNIRWLQPRDPDEPKQAYLQVAVSYLHIPPKIIVITSKTKSVLSEETINILDWAEIDNIDLIVRPYNWDVNGKKGVKAYVKSMYVTLAEDDFESKYREVPDAASSPAEEDAPF